MEPIPTKTMSHEREREGLRKKGVVAAPPASANGPILQGLVWFGSALLPCSDEGQPVSGDESMHEILQKALLRTIHDIDTKFSLEAFNNRYISGSTATIVLLVDGQILVASVGDSKALLCSEKIKAALGDEGASITVLDVEELTRDHHPDRDDERARIEAAGGFVRLWGVPRVNGSYTEDQPTSMEPQWLTSYPCCLLQRQSLLCIRLMDNRKKGIASTFHNLWNVCTAKDHRHLG
ncbi:unnamed protein product [Camellia sinensis]